MDAPVLGTYGRTASSDDAPPITVDTVFSLASVSKPFAGAVVATLLDQQLIQSLDDDICESVFEGVMDTNCRHPSYPDVPVTWRMLVTHRTGLVRNPPTTSDGIDVTYGPTGVYPDTGGNDKCPIDDVVQFYEALLTDKDTETTVGQDGGYAIDWYDLAQEENPVGGSWNQTLQPGEKSVYSNLGAGYVAALIERMTGEKFETYSRQQIFDKIGMTNTAWFRRDLPNNTLEAMPVLFDNETDTWEDIGYYCWANYADGQLRSSIADMSKWADVHLNYGIDTLWSNVTAMRDVYGCQENDVNGDRLEGTECEFALNWEHLGNEKRNALAETAAFGELDWTNGILHNGGELGVATEILILPESGAYVITLLNTEEDVSYFQEGIAHAGMSLLLDMGAPGLRGFDALEADDDDSGNDDGDDSNFDDSKGDDDSVGDDDSTNVEASKSGESSIEKNTESMASAASALRASFLTLLLFVAV